MFKKKTCSIICGVVLVVGINSHDNHKKKNIYIYQQQQTTQEEFLSRLKTQKKYININKIK